MAQQNRNEMSEASLDWDVAPVRPLSHALYLNYVKRCVDLVLSVMLLVILLPVLLCITLIASLDGGPPIFAHERIGKGGRPFKCLKFRTMRVDADVILKSLLASDPAAATEWAADHKLSHDPRVTWIGHFLRRTSMDELPQLLNVIRGDMSLVGPRPVTLEELEKYRSRLFKYLSLRPGLTGIWQVYGRGKVSYRERTEMDARYYQTVNFMGDLRLILQTAVVVLRRRGQ